MDNDGNVYLCKCMIIFVHDIIQIKEKDETMKTIENVLDWT